MFDISLLTKEPKIFDRIIESCQLIISQTNQTLENNIEQIKFVIK